MFWIKIKRLKIQVLRIEHFQPVFHPKCKEKKDLDMGAITNWARRADLACQPSRAWLYIYIYIKLMLFYIFFFKIFFLFIFILVPPPLSLSF